MRLLSAVTLCGLFTAMIAGSRALALTMLLAAGSNYSFDASLPPLSYAASDAEQFTGAMRSVGLMSNDETVFKPNPSHEELLRAFDQATAVFSVDKGLGARKFIFYYSGHADERGLHLRDGLFTIDELHKRLASVSARTKVIILDSCYAASLAMKGVRPVKGMLGPKIDVDEPTGTLFLTASSARDVALESSVTHGSLFTRQLISGLYGEADGNRDGVVTATELYEYAFRKTQLASYLLPISMPQKPEFISDLKGRGAVTLSFPAGRMGRLQFPSDLAGKISIQALASASSVELQKQRGVVADVPLPIGAYQLLIRDKAQTGRAHVTVSSDRIAAVIPGEIAWRSDASTGEELAMAKGAPTVPPPPRAQLAAAFGASQQTKGMSGEVSVSRGYPGAVETSLLLTVGSRYQFHDTEFGRQSERRHAAFLGYLWNPLLRDAIVLGLESGLGLAFIQLNMDGESGKPVGYDRFAVGRVGLRLSVLTSRIWLGLHHEAALRSDFSAHRATPRAWDTASLGFAL